MPATVLGPSPFPPALALVEGTVLSAQVESSLLLGTGQIRLQGACIPGEGLCD